MTTVSRKTRILFIQPDLNDQAGLEVRKELRNLDQALLLERKGAVWEWELLPAAQLTDLAQGLARYQPDIVHYAGHGGAQGELYFDPNEDKKNSVALSAEDFAETLRIHQARPHTPRVRLVVLAACHTERTAQLAVEHVDCAIGMSDAIGDDALVKVLTPNFYAALARGDAVQDAVENARIALRSQEYGEDAAMVQLFARAGMDQARLVLTGLSQPPAVDSQAHEQYLHALFRQKWAAVRMKLFDPRIVDVVPLPQIYSPLPVDFSIRLKPDKHGRVDSWWCGRGRQERGEREAKEAWEQVLNERIEGATSKETLPDRQEQSHTWADLQADENALQPLLTLASEQARQQSTDRRGERKTEPIQWQAEAEHAALVQRRFVLIGDPGSGKSTFLRHLALSWAAGRLAGMGETRTRLDSGAYLELNFASSWSGPPVTPIYIELRSLVETFTPLPEGEDLPDMPGLVTFEDYLRSQLAAMGCAAAFDGLLALLESGRAAILLDGLDEVSDADDHRRRMQVQHFVGALQKAFDQAPIMVTSRPYAYRLDTPEDPERWELKGFGYTTLVPLEPERQRSMARRVFACLRPDDRRRADQFLAALPSVPPDLPCNPLLLTLLAAVSLRRPPQEPHALPKTRGELYDRALTLLIEDWVKEHNERFVARDDIGLDSPDLRRALQLVARRAQERSTERNQAVLIERTDFYAALDDIGKGETTPKLVQHLQWTAGMLLDQAEQSPGAMASPAPGRFRFLHLSFQEYLAACDMLFRPGTVHARSGRPLWDERPFPDALVQRVLQAPRLWANVLRLAVDVLLAKERGADAWELLALCCQPYQKEGSTASAGLLALDVAHKAGLFTAEPPWAVQHCYQMICAAAKRALEDHPRDGHPGLTPEQRDIAGQLLGSGAFPGHDGRQGVGLRQDGLPDIAWVKVPELDAKGKGEWTYQSRRHRPLDTFWIARYPITYAQFQVFLDAEDGFKEDRWWKGLAASAEHRARWDGQQFKHWNHPRVRVSWWNAMAFCAWLTAKARQRPGLLPQGGCSGDWRITLPTEQQWEKAARGHDGRQYPWGGNKYRSGYANINETLRQVGPHYLQKSSAVGMYPQGVSPYGVADLSGNVWEWCLNEYESGKTDPGGDATRVLRGGSWDNLPDFAAVPFRHHNRPGTHGNFHGFRVVVVGWRPNA